MQVGSVMLMSPRKTTGVVMRRIFYLENQVHAFLTGTLNVGACSFLDIVLLYDWFLL